MAAVFLESRNNFRRGTHHCLGQLHQSHFNASKAVFVAFSEVMKVHSRHAISHPVGRVVVQLRSPPSVDYQMSDVLQREFVQDVVNHCSELTSLSRSFFLPTCIHREPRTDMSASIARSSGGTPDRKRTVFFSCFAHHCFSYCHWDLQVKQYFFQLRLVVSKGSEGHFSGHIVKGLREIHMEACSVDFVGTSCLTLLSICCWFSTSPPHERQAFYPLPPR